MAKKIKIFETKLEQFVGEGYEVEDLKVITKEIELDTSFKQTNRSIIREQIVQKQTSDVSTKEKKEASSTNKKILLLHDDGTNTEIMHQIKRIIDWLIRARYISFNVIKQSGSERAEVRDGCIVTGQTLTEALNCLIKCLRQSFDLLEDAYLLETAVQMVLESGLRTEDMKEPGTILVSCEKMGSAVITELKLIEQGFCLE